MSLSIEPRLSDEDWSLIETHKLGTPVGIYGLRSIYINTLRGSGVFFLALGTALCTFLFLSYFVKRSNGQAHKDLIIIIIGLVLLMCLSIFFLIAGVFVLRVEIPRAKRVRLIICEQGLLSIGKGAKGKDVDVVYWSSILALRKFANPYKVYNITYQENKEISFDAMYQNIEEIIMRIRQQSEKA